MVMKRQQGMRMGNLVLACASVPFSASLPKSSRAGWLAGTCGLAGKTHLSSEDLEEES